MFNMGYSENKNEFNSERQDVQKVSQNQNAVKKHEKTPATVAQIAFISFVSLVIVCSITLLFLQAKFKEPLVFTASDWLKMVIPLIISFTSIVFAFLGVDRLKNFDERQDRLSKELKQEINASIEGKINILQPKLEKLYSDWEKEAKEKLEEFNKTYSEEIERIGKQINKYNDVFGSITHFENIMETIGNVAEANQYISNLFNQDASSASDINSDEKSIVQKKHILSEIVERVRKEMIRGSDADYHNLSSELARNDYFDLAVKVACAGHKLFPDDIDLLSDCIYYISKAGEKENLEHVKAELEKIDYTKWNWRAFTFYIQTLNAEAAAEENFKKTYTAVEKYKEVLPFDERAYMAEYEMYKKYGNLEKAEDALIQAENSLKVTAQCSLRLAEIRLSRGEYNDAIKSANRAIVSQAETQPSSSTG